MGWERYFTRLTLVLTAFYQYQTLLAFQEQQFLDQFAIEQLVLAQGYRHFDQKYYLIRSLRLERSSKMQHQPPN
jgi:hypothetical protein